jgi:hypothetical protein
MAPTAAAPAHRGTAASSRKDPACQGTPLDSLQRTSGRTPTRDTPSRIMSSGAPQTAPRTEIRLGARRAGHKPPVAAPFSASAIETETPTT